METINNKNEYLIELGKRIREKRKTKGMTLEELALASGYSGRSSMATIEAGKRDISTTKIVAIAKALGVSPLYLSTGIEENKNVPVDYVVKGTPNTKYLSQKDISDVGIIVEQYVTNEKPVEVSATEMLLLYEIKKMSKEEQELLLKMISKNKKEE